MKRFIYASFAAILCLSVTLAFAGSFSSGSRGGGFSSGGFSSRSYSSGSSYSRSYSSPSYSTPKSFSSPSFSASKPSTGGSFSSPTFKATTPATSGSFSSKSFTPSRPIAPAPYYSGGRQGYSYSQPGTVVEHHYYNSGPSMGNFWFWMWAFDHNNNGNGGYYGAPGGYVQPGVAGVAPGGAVTPLIPVYTPLWERTIIIVLNILLLGGFLWLLVWGLWKIAKAVD